MSYCNRTLRPDGPALTAFRKLFGWTQSELEWQTVITVENRAAAERAEGNPRGEFSRHMRKRKRQGRLIGVSQGAIASAEHGNATFPWTLKVLALTLGVDVSQIVRATGKDDDMGNDAGRMPTEVEHGRHTVVVAKLLERISKLPLIDFAWLIAWFFAEAERRGLGHLVASHRPNDTGSDDDTEIG